MQMIYYSLPDSPFLSPEDVVGSFDLKEGEKALDFGAGSGYWAIPLAQAVGKSGHVFVSENKKESLSVVKNKAERAGLNNISYHEGLSEEKIFPIKTKLDFILISNVLNETKDPEPIFSEIKKLSKNGTRLVIIEWKKESIIGPKKEKRIDEEEIILKLAKINFEFKKLLFAGAHHTGLYFVCNK